MLAWLKNDVVRGVWGRFYRKRPSRVRGVSADPLADILASVPVGIYLVEQRGDARLLWRISEGEPSDEALAPAALWPMLLPE
jgi:hypothetical protein